MYHVTQLNKEQADDFLRKYLQDNIKIVDFTYYDDEGDDIYFVTLVSGKLFHKVETHWQFRPVNLISSAVFGSVHVGLCFGEYRMPDVSKRFDIYECSPELLKKANEIVWKHIEKWKKVSPV